jgi:hypothetical protein
MKPFSIVIHFDVVEDVLLGLNASDEAFAMYSLDLETMVSAFHGGIIVTVAFFAYAAN